MSTLVNCPKCRIEIESDSYYCDQCGVELYICPKCHVFGKGKRCTQCGQPLVSAREAAGEGAVQPVSSAQPSATKPAESSKLAEPSKPIVQESSRQTVASSVPGFERTSPVPEPEKAPSTPKPESTPPASEPEKTMRPGVPAPPLPVRLVCSAAGIRLGLGDGAVIGRRHGDYVSAFASQGYVSGTHARLQKNASNQWEITDLDSTNGTFINGNRLSPNIPAAFGVGDVVRIANLDFKVE